MYHDQGLTAFKALCFEESVNYTAGLSIIRTSPGHGTAFDLVGKEKANPESMRNAIYMALDVFRNREYVEDATKNPLKISKEKTHGDGLE
jgi:4-hydroxythreonine-4-phosphate dehydrogenase